MTDVLIDSYSESNYNLSLNTYSYEEEGQSFTARGGVLKAVKFYLCKNSELSSGNLVAKIYAHSGTFGSSSVGTGEPLATSDIVDATTLPTFSSFALTTFNFSGNDKITLIDGEKYVVVVENIDADAYIMVGGDISGSHDGNKCRYNKNTETWSYSAGYDICFYIYTQAIGYTTVGSSNSGTSDDIRGSKFTISETIYGISIAAYVDDNFGSVNNPFKYGIYDTSGNLIAETEQKVIPSQFYEGWITANFSSEIKLEPQDIVLVVFTNLGGWDIKYDEGDADQGYIDEAVSWDEFPDPASFANDTNKYTIYLNYKDEKKDEKYSSILPAFRRS
jgi:hypothetical protein